MPSILLGLSFSFHPAVGLWAIPAIGLALLFEKISMPNFVKVVIITGIFSLFGLIPLIAEQTNAAANSFENWQFSRHLPDALASRFISIFAQRNRFTLRNARF